jgi:hypothetical protein
MPPLGLEPRTYWLKASYSDQLSYGGVSETVLQDKSILLVLYCQDIHGKSFLPTFFAIVTPGLKGSVTSSHSVLKFFLISIGVL